MQQQYTVEQMEYESAQYDNNAAMIEGFDATEIEHDAPYIARGRRNAPQQPGYYQNPNMQHQQYQQPYGYAQPQQQYGYGQPNNVAALNQQQEQMQRGQGPTYDSAYRNLERYDNMLNNLGQMNVTHDSSDAQQYALGVAMESLSSAITALNEIDYWIPKGKEHLTPKFAQAAVPVLKGLTAYLAALERIQ